MGAHLQIHSIRGLSSGWLEYRVLASPPSQEMLRKYYQPPPPPHALPHPSSLVGPRSEHIRSSHFLFLLGRSLTKETLCFAGLMLSSEQQVLVHRHFQKSKQPSLLWPSASQRKSHLYLILYVLIVMPMSGVWFPLQLRSCVACEMRSPCSPGKSCQALLLPHSFLSGKEK